MADLLVSGIFRHRQSHGGDPDHRHTRLHLRHVAPLVTGADHTLESGRFGGGAMTDAQLRWLPLPIFGTILLIWELVVRQSGQLALYPYPGGVIEAAIRTLSNGSLLAATSGSLSRVLLGFAIGAL